jgi:hypothetical protein
MEATSALIERYWTQDPVGEGQEYPGKIDLLMELEDREEMEVTDFLLDVLDREQYDLARIEALKILEVRTVSQHERARVGQAIMRVMLTDSDEDTRTYATRAMSPYMQSPGAFEAMNTVVTSPTYGLNQRHSAVASLERSGYSSQASAILGRAVSDPELSRSAQWILNDWGVKI